MTRHARECANGAAGGSGRLNRCVRAPLGPRLRMNRRDFLDLTASMAVAPAVGAFPLAQGLPAGRVRARDLGIVTGELAPGPLNAITDVEGVLVGHSTIVRGDGALKKGEGPVRTGVTAVLPHKDVWRAPVLGATHTLNGDGELTGVHWVRDLETIAQPVLITNTASVGTVHEAAIAYAVEKHGGGSYLPVVGETWDGRLNDIDGFHVKREHVYAAIDHAAAGPVAEGNVGGGTGMICYSFKGGIGTASRRLAASAGGFTVGVLLQANFGRRSTLMIGGVPVGREIPLGRRAAALEAPARGPRRLGHRRHRHRRAGVVASARTDVAPRDAGPGANRHVVRQRQRRHLRGVLHGEPVRARRRVARADRSAGTTRRTWTRCFWRQSRPSRRRC